MGNDISDRIEQVQTETGQLLSEIQDAEDRIEDNIDELWTTLADSNREMYDELNSLSSEISTAEDDFNADPLHDSIRDANSEMYDLYLDTWNELYSDRGSYPEVWEQVEDLFDYHNESVQDYQEVLDTKDAVFNDAWSEYQELRNARNEAIENALTDYYAAGADLNEAKGDLYDIYQLQEQILYEAQTQFYATDSASAQFIQDYNRLEASWQDWVDDTDTQLNLWETILGDDNRWYAETEPTPKSGPPLIGIIDTGFVANHPDINPPQILLGQDRIDGDDNPLLEGGHRDAAHGTQILEVISATRNNEIGIDGINPDAPVWLGRAVGSDDWAQSLIEFVDSVKESEQPNAVANLSFDLTETDSEGNVTTRYELTPLEKAALTYAEQNQVLVVTSAGNEGSDLSALGKAVQDFDNIIVVGAAEDWEAADYSSYDSVDYNYYGKGVDILAQGTADNGASGTSVAAAKVTGAASLVWSANPDLNYTQVIELLKRSATDLETPGWDVQTGSGLLNIASAVYLAKAAAAEAYQPDYVELVDHTLKVNNIPEVYWPQFYNLYHYYDLEAKLTGDAWIGEGGDIASERETQRYADGEFVRGNNPGYYYFRSEFDSQSEAQKYVQSLGDTFSLFRL